MADIERHTRCSLPIPCARKAADPEIVAVEVLFEPSSGLGGAANGDECGHHLYDVITVERRQKLYLFAALVQVRPVATFLSRPPS